MEFGKCEMEDLVANKLFEGVYENRKVLVTGHSGFKGSWLVTWLQMLGAQVVGYSHKAPDNTRHFHSLNLPMESVTGDICDIDKLQATIERVRPEIVFHLAAQSLVRKSYKEPINTYNTNVMGSLTLYQACLLSSSVKGIVSVTSDKVYENKEVLVPYNEDDLLGGYDMYSSSKACVELVTNSFRNSFLKKDGGHMMNLVTARAGNVIGGGDWAEDRLIPDIMRAIEQKQAAVVRNPLAVRPWQHVLEPLSGYLLLGQRMLKHRSLPGNSWNFGPSSTKAINVEDIVSRIKNIIPSLQFKMCKEENPLHEATMLMVDSSKATSYLDWIPVWDAEAAVSITAKWYRYFIEDGTVSTGHDIIQYVNDAKKNKVTWSCNDY